MKTIIAIISAAALSGCATSNFGPAGTGADYEPLVDLRPGQHASYFSDVAECQGYASRVAGAGEGAVGGAVAGALIGGLFSAIIGGGGHGRFAAISGITGALSGAAAGAGNRKQVIDNCMRGRGYSVLN